MPIHLEVEGGYYACNHAVGPGVKKKTKRIHKVTCKNCLRYLDKIRQMAEQCPNIPKGYTDDSLKWKR